MNTFGVCTYDFDATHPTVCELKRFDTYDEAYKYYLLQITEVRRIPKTLWIVWIDEKDNIVQFEQLQSKIRCKRVSL